jgi:hypothetical protein
MSRPLSRIDRFLLGLVAGMLLALAIVFVSHAHSQTIVTGGNRKVFPAYVNPCTLPLYDTFIGTGALSSCWTPYGTSTALRSGVGSAAPNTSNEFGFEALASTTTPADQTAIVSINWLTDPARSGPIVRADPATGNAYAWKVGTGDLVAITSGIAVALSLGTCPAAASGDVVQLSVSGNTLTCTDLTTFAAASFVDTANTYTTGRPGFIIDGTAETDVSAGPFTASAP